MSAEELKTGGVSPEEEEVDPRVQNELEILNSASNEINNLERELERARNKFRSLMTDSTQKLNGLHKKLGKVVHKSRTYYELCKSSRKSQLDTHKAALDYQRANSVYKTAKETVALAEEKISGEKGESQLDPAWQELLNHATSKFMDSDRDRTRAEQNHLAKSAEYAAIQQKIHFYEKDVPRSIAKSRPYFELKERLEHNLMAERQNVEDLSQALGIKKTQYRAALNNLEQISEEVHARRKTNIQLPPRSPGVGAESTSDQSDLPSINLDILSETSSQVSYDEFEEGISISSDTGFESDTISLSSDTHGEFPYPGTATAQGLGGRSDSPKPSARVMPMVRHHTSPGLLGSNRPGSPGLPKAMRALGLHDSLRRAPSDPSSHGVRFKPQHPQHAAMGAAPVTATAVSASAFDFEAPANMTSSGKVTSSSGKVKSSETRVESDAERRARREQKKLQTQKAFPILAGLSETHKQLSPRLGRAVLARTAVPAYQSLSPQHSPRLQQRTSYQTSPYSSPLSSPHHSPKIQHRSSVPNTTHHVTTGAAKVTSHQQSSTSSRVDHKGDAAVAKSSDVSPRTPTTLPVTPLSGGIILDSLPPLQSVVKPQSQYPQVAKVLPQPQTPTDQSQGNQLSRKQLPSDPFPRYQLPQQMVQPLVANGNKSGLFDDSETTTTDLSNKTDSVTMTTPDKEARDHDNASSQRNAAP